MDYPEIYYLLHQAMGRLGLAETDWALGENKDLIFFNYLGKTIRQAGERVEHYRIWVKNKGNISQWTLVRHGADKTLFPRLRAKQKEIIKSLVDKNIFIIFQDDWRGREIKKVNLNYHRQKFVLQFVLPNIGFSREERKFFANSVIRESAEETRSDFKRLEINLRRHIDLIKKVEKKIKKSRRKYEIALRAHLKKLTKDEREKIQLVKDLAKRFRFSDEIKGRPWRRSRKMIKGMVVREPEINKYIGREKIILAVKDLEPALTVYLKKVKAVLASRGAICSHAAAICREFSLPLLTATKNLNLLKTGDKILINFKNGRVKKITK